MVVLAAVEFLLEKIRELLLYHSGLISGSLKQFRELEENLQFFQAFLRKSAAALRQGDPRLQEIIRRIRVVVYEAEDTIDALVTQAAETRPKNFFRRAFPPVNLLSTIEDVTAVCSRIRDVYGHMSSLDFTSCFVGDGSQRESKAPLVRQDNVVGFEDEAAKLIGYLKEDTEQLDVISVIGMPGLGKTTLARKIFCDPEIEYRFYNRIWVYVSQEFTTRNLFLSILTQITMLSDDMCHKSDEELAKLVRDHLERGQFLIVMDDVWTPHDWEKLKVALPKSNKLGKVLITSRNEGVAQSASRSRDPHRLRFLNSEESWLLLQLEVFGEPECPCELEYLGKLIAVQCDGLPLAIVVIGGILAERSPRPIEMSKVKYAWRKVSESVSAYLYNEPQGRMEESISLSYDTLPFFLKSCFLYFGMFPEAFEVPVWKLNHMWIAEGFIQQKHGISLEETAENYLEDLIGRNLVRTYKMRPNGRLKTCGISKLLRYFCIIEARRQNFFQEIKNSGDGVPSEAPASDLREYRRLCVHSNVLNFISSKPIGPRVRSFVCLSEEEIILPAEYISTIPAAFKLLRVLDVKPIKFTKTPFDLYHLVHLRYIFLSLNLAILPAAFSKLWNIQTLIVNTTSRTLEIKADIWKMTQLRHLMTNASTTLPKTGQSSKEAESLQTLGTISPQSCTEEVFNRARNLKKLGIRGRLAWLLDGKSGSFDSLGKLDNLEKLKLLNDVFPSRPSEGQLPRLPAPYKFPPKLRSLTLSDTFLDWSHMSVLGFLGTLEMLKLKSNAFMGKYWEVADGGFRCLEVLHIENTNLVFWNASGDHFPRLTCLELSYCEELQEIPFGLAAIRSLIQLNLYHSKHAAASAKKIYEAKKNQEEQTTKINGFKLSIFPPDE